MDNLIIKKFFAKAIKEIPTPEEVTYLVVVFLLGIGASARKKKGGKGY